MPALLMLESAAWRSASQICVAAAPASASPTSPDEIAAAPIEIEADGVEEVKRADGRERHGDERGGDSFLGSDEDGPGEWHVAAGQIGAAGGQLAKDLEEDSPADLPEAEHCDCITKGKCISEAGCDRADPQCGEQRIQEQKEDG